MSKYSFDRMQPDEFESMSQALLEKTYRIHGNLIQFGPGKDGGREATWTQDLTHVGYQRPVNENSDIPKEWVFQVKYHDISQRGWTSARDAVVEDLEKELDKILNKHKVPCHAYVMITNVPFTGVRDLGTRDKISAVTKAWRDRIPQIFVWDAADISRLLDANESVRTAYLDTILPGDLIKAICKGVSFHADRTKSAFRAYLKFITEREGVARAEEAGDEPGLPLVDVFVDLTMRPQHDPFWDIDKGSNRNSRKLSADKAGFLPKDYANTPSSFALLIANHDRTLVLGGPGLGKSTLTQFAAIFHAARLVDQPFSKKLAGRLKLPDEFGVEHLDSHCQLRFPFRIELRRYARWMGDEQKNGRKGEIARYIVEMLINPNVSSSSLNMDDIFELASSDPLLLILDGLDEVPHPDARKQILENVQIFFRRVQSENGDIQLLLSSRPKGYSGEFNVFEPFIWELNNLEISDFNEYCGNWLRKRIRDAAEISEALDRIERGMKSEAVQRLAQSLLQATVMLTIVRRKNEIPHQRHALYAKYVEVIFDREKEKSQVVRDHGDVLYRLHERVGFELHRKMDQTSIEALDADSFRAYVLNVLEDYSGVNLGTRKIREIADEIIIASTDRLCLLIGKGKDQADIDFVVQSYREYFASVYLFKHPDADPDKVFQALVRRGGYWANVLQFYVAQANTNQQMRWVLSADGYNVNYNSADDIVTLIRTRRSLANMLPEFNSQRNSDFGKALRIIFSIETRWSWLNQEAVLEILTVLRSGSAKNIFTEWTNSLSETDEGALAAELWLLYGLSSNDSLEAESFRLKIQELLHDAGAAHVALATALAKKIQIDLSSCAMDLLRKPGVSHGDIPVKIFAKQSYEKQCELMLEGFDPDGMRPRPTNGITGRIVEALCVTSEITIFNGRVTLQICPYITRSLDTLPELDKLKSEIPNRNKATEYLIALFDAVLDPENPETDTEVRRIEGTFADESLGLWEAESIIGPSTGDFSASTIWEAFKCELTEINNQENDWISELQNFMETNLTWTILLFHADEWPLLIDNNLLSMDSYTSLLKSPLGRLYSQPTMPLNVIQLMRFNDDNKTEIPLKEILDVALKIVETKGIQRIGSGWLLSALLSNGTIKAIPKEEAEVLLRRLMNCPPLPLGWSAAVLRLCIETCTDIQTLVKLWHHVKDPQKLHFGMPSKELSSDINEKIQELLDLDQEDALRIVLRILNNGRTDPTILSRFISCWSSFLSSNEYDDYARVNSILSQTPSIHEFKLWAQWDTSLDNCFRKYPWLFRKLIDRFDEAIKQDHHLDPCLLLTQLSQFIVRRHEFPWLIPCAALEARLKLDERNYQPMENSEWQQTAGCQEQIL